MTPPLKNPGSAPGDTNVERGSKLWELSTCSVKVRLRCIELVACFMLKVVCLVEHSYIGEVLIQIWLKSIQK